MAAQFFSITPLMIGPLFKGAHVDDVLPVVVVVGSDADGDDGVEANLANHVGQGGYHVRLEVAVHDRPPGNSEVVQKVLQGFRAPVVAQLCTRQDMTREVTSKGQYIRASAAYS